MLIKVCYWSDWPKACHRWSITGTTFFRKSPICKTLKQQHLFFYSFTKETIKAPNKEIHWPSNELYGRRDKMKLHCETRNAKDDYCTIEDQCGSNKKDWKWFHHIDVIDRNRRATERYVAGCCWKPDRRSGSSVTFSIFTLLVPFTVS